MSTSAEDIGSCPLFQAGDFTLASGAKSRWKIECDALSYKDWDGLAVIAAEWLPPFKIVLGVPRGGLPFASALTRYIDLRAPYTLIVDDVWTTGESMRQFVKEQSLKAEWLTGLVAFARNRPDWWCKAIFTMGNSAR